MKLFTSFPDDLAAWAQRQPVFFTASAPTYGAHINVSPKGLSSTHFSVLSPNLCAYIDRTGSGNETISHAYENGRLCLMFISFGDTPRILRLFCRSRVVEWDHPSFEQWVGRIADDKRGAFDGARAVIIADIWQVQTSCGYGVPRVIKGLYQSEDDKEVDLNLRGSPLKELAVFETRPTLDNWAASQAESNKTLGYQEKNNCTSMDGLPGLRTARRSAGETLWFGDLKARLRRISMQGEGILVGFLFAVSIYVVLRSLGSL